jgi:iron complex outermembrane recepter protein
MPLIAAVLCLHPAAATELDISELTDLSLEQLSNIEITSVSRHAERLSDAPASVFVITGEDIRRSGATSLPEALRLAPNLMVARTSADTYAISARGFNNSLGNKLLVLIDGRIVYTPLFSGVFWDAQDVMLEDVERIEVISGPGATLWGANAVNGVINVITRSARDTQGGLLAAGGGNRDNGGAFRIGAPVGAGGHARFYGKLFARHDTERSNGTSAMDGSSLGQIGFRADWNGVHDEVMLQGNAYSGSSERVALGTPQLAGVNLVGRWKRKLGEDSDLTLQAYYDRTEREDPGVFSDTMDVFDFEFQHAIALGRMHHVVWGAGYRAAQDRTDPGVLFAFYPERRNLAWANLFIQDQIELAPRVELTLGAKAESNDYTDVEFLPTVRLAWKPTDDRLLWGAISRAVRAPSRIDREFYFFVPLNPPVYIIKGGPDFQSEIVDVFEVGYRAQPSSSISYSISTFYNIYDKLRSGQPAPAFVQNMIEGTTYGIEAWGSYQASSAWRLSAGVLALQKDLRLKPGSTDPVGPSALGNDPEEQWMLRSLLNITQRHELDVMIRHVSGLPDPTVPAYTAVDFRLGWRPDPRLELSLTVQNAFDPSHPEFDAAPTRSEYDRSYYLELIWRF